MYWPGLVWSGRSVSAGMGMVVDWVGEGMESGSFVVIVVTVVVYSSGTAAWLDKRRYLMYLQRLRAAETVSAAVAAAAACDSVCYLLC